MLARLWKKLRPSSGPKAPRSRGQGLLEFALILPLLLLFVLGIIEAGRMLAIYSSLSSAAKQAARYGSVAGDSAVGGPLAFYEDCNGIRQAALRSSILVGLDTDDIGIGYDRGNAAEPIGRCGVNDPTPTLLVTETIKDGYRIVITTTAIYRPLVPIVPLPDLTINFTAARTIFTSIVGPTNTPRPDPDLRITKVGLPLVVSPNGTLSYWLTATNPLTGVVLANNVYITDTLPVSVTTVTTDTLTSILNTYNWNCAFTTFSPPPQKISCSRTAPLAPGQSAGFMLPVRVPLFGGVTLTNTAGVQSSKIDINDDDNYTETVNVVLPGADLQAFKTASLTQVGAGTPLTYSLWAVNNGGDISRVRTNPSASATYIWITDTLPAGLTGAARVVQPLPAGWTCPNVSATVVGCRYGVDLGIGASTPQLTVVITAPMTAQTLLNTAVVTPSTLTADPLLLNNVVTATAEVVTDADIELFMGVPSGPFDLNHQFTIRLNVTNRGRSVASGIGITYNLPGGLAYDSFSGGPNWSGCTPSGATLVCTYAPTIYPGTTSTDLVLTVHGIAVGDQTSVADASGAQPDPDAATLDTHAQGTTVITNCAPGVAYGPSSTISGGSPNQVQADGTTESTIVVELRDRCNALVTTSQSVTLSSDRGGVDTISAPAYNQAQGQATFKVKSSATGVANFTATVASPDPAISGTATVTYYGCVSLSAGAVGGAPQFLQYSVDNTSGMSRRLIALELNWPAGGSKRFTGVSMQATSVWTGSTNNSPFTISGGNWIAGTDGTRTVPNSPASPLPVLLLNFNFTVVSNPPTQFFGLKTTWDDSNGGSLCSHTINITR